MRLELVYHTGIHLPTATTQQCLTVTEASASQVLLIGIAAGHQMTSTDTAQSTQPVAHWYCTQVEGVDGHSTVSNTHMVWSHEQQ